MRFWAKDEGRRAGQRVKGGKLETLFPGRPPRRGARAEGTLAWWSFNHEILEIRGSENPIGASLELQCGVCLRESRPMSGTVFQEIKNSLRDFYLADTRTADMEGGVCRVVI